MTSSFSRRRFLTSLAGLPLMAPLIHGFPRHWTESEQPPPASPRRRRKTSVAVVGAGPFGGWTALWLQRAGADVTLVDAWGPGNPRASSGGESRVIRGTYGPNRIYVQWVARALEVWRESERLWDERLYQRTGGLWMFERDDSYARTSLPLQAEMGLPARELTLEEARAMFPQIDFDGIRTIFFEDEAGYLRARHACRAVAEAFVEEGGAYRQAMAKPGELRGGEMTEVTLSGGEALRADRYVFACGPWMGRLFPEVIGDRVQPSRQEVFYFGIPPGTDRFGESRLPCWLNGGEERFFYGIPGNDGRGFKIADDTRGEPVDPTTLERSVSPDHLRRAREFIARRFPELAGAPLVESRVCQYENSPDGDFIIDRHPDAANVWLLGGGSGHGYKMGPALGEFAAGLVAGNREPLARFELRRFEASSE